MPPKKTVKQTRHDGSEPPRTVKKAKIAKQTDSTALIVGGNAPSVEITELLSNQHSTIFRKVLSYITHTDLMNLKLLTRTISANLLWKTPATSQRCEAIRCNDVRAQDQVNIHGPPAPCHIVTPLTGRTRVYWCEGPNLRLPNREIQDDGTCVPLANPETHCVPICGKCIHEALNDSHPKEWYAYSPLCHACSVRELEVHPYGTNPCTCLSPFTSPLIRAKLCSACRVELSHRSCSLFFRMMEQKLPVLNPGTPAGPSQGRWRVPAANVFNGEDGWPPGGYEVGCRGCHRNYQQLMDSYLSCPEAGPTTHLSEDHPDYEDWWDAAWVYNKGMRLMIFKCLECDKHVDWESVMRGNLPQ